MLLLFRKQYEDDSYELSPIVVSESDRKIEDYLSNLLKDSIDYDDELKKHIIQCKIIIRDYLINNYDAITGWRNVTGFLKTSYPISDEDKDKVINFLCNNCSYYYGENIVEVPYDNGFINKYCDIEKLSKPYPKLSMPPERPNPYYKRDEFCIKKIENLD